MAGHRCDQILANSNSSNSFGVRTNIHRNQNDKIDALDLHYKALFLTYKVKKRSILINSSSW